jgi:hypothetical protein
MTHQHDARQVASITRLAAPSARYLWAEPVLYGRGRVCLSAPSARLHDWAVVDDVVDAALVDAPSELLELAPVVTVDGQHLDLLDPSAGWKPGRPLEPQTRSISLRQGPSGG